MGTTYYDATSFEGNWTLNQATGNGRGQTLAWYVGDARAASLTDGHGNILNQVVLGAAFMNNEGGYGADPATSEEITVLHEALHAYKNDGDVDLATSLGLWQKGMTQNQASDLISTRLSQCFK